MNRTRLLPSDNVSEDGKYKIPRIPVFRCVRCEVSHVSSPSCIWIKPINHITEQLQIYDISQLTRASAVLPHHYVMAPLREGVFARARVRCSRVISSKDGRSATFTKVLFIDYGHTDWIASKALAKMNHIFSFHPWQAIATSLFMLFPKSNEWSAEENDLLLSIIHEYNVFLAEVAPNSAPSNDYREFVKVKLFGLTSDTDSTGISIAHEFARRWCSSGCIKRELYDGVLQPIFSSCEDKDDLSCEEIIAIAAPSWKNQPLNENQKGFKETLWAQKTDQNDGIAFPQVSSFSISAFCDEGYCLNNQMFVMVEGRCTVSPYEFYVRPLRLKHLGMGIRGVSMDKMEDAMIAVDEEFLKFSDELNAFYGQARNRQPVDTTKVNEAFENGIRVFGIVQGDIELTQLSGCWQRVEVFGIKESGHGDGQSCRARFLDSGGTKIYSLSSIFRIHPRHCSHPPLCLQICLHGVKPLSPEWSEGAKKFFSRALREDVPVHLQLIACPRSYDHTICSYDCPAHRRPSVIFVNLIQVHDGSAQCLNAQLVENGFAELAIDSPVPLA